jgi:hydroxypyruvate isomerase
MLFTERPFAQRFDAAAAAGFVEVEFPFVDTYPAAQLKAWLDASGLKQALANMPSAPDGTGQAACVGRQPMFRQAFLQGLDYAIEARCQLLHVTAGRVAPAKEVEADAAFLENMRWAIDEASRQGVTLLIEAINQRAAPDYFIRSLASAAAWCRRLPGLGLLLDIYHASVEGLDPVEAIAAYCSLTRHIQIAGVPARQEPDIGDLDLSAIHRALKTAGYQGAVGCEYNPIDGTEAGLGWIRQWSGEDLAHA